MQISKLAVVILLLTSTIAIRAASQKPYTGTDVVIQSSWVNEGGLRLILGHTAKSPSRIFTLGCNDDDETCLAPSIGETARLIELSEPHYKCDEYALRVGSKTVPVCLQSVY